VHDKKAEWAWGVLAELEAAGLIVLADKGYQGSAYAKTPYKRKNKPESQKQANRAHAKLRALVDVNHGSQEALCHLPGITPEIARRIAETRESVGFFKSAEDLGISLDLSPSLVDDIREYAVFL
jgi:DNA uptake protein ComE-like DNA-binding protein